MKSHRNRPISISALFSLLLLLLSAMPGVAQTLPGESLPLLPDTIDHIVVPEQPPAKPSTPEEIKRRLGEIIDVLLGEYVEDPGTDTLFRNAVRGIVSNLDPYTSYFEPKQYSQFKERNKGTYAGLGIRITQRGEFITVITPIPKSPAKRAGVQPGDKVYLIDGKDARNISLEDAVNVLRGERGSTVTITVLRDGFDTPIPITITRDIIKLPTVESALIKDYGYIRIYQFKEVTARQFEEELGRLLKNDIVGLIIDVRHNPGGLLNSVLQICSNLLEPGKVIVMTQGRVSPKKVYVSHHRPIRTDLPLVVMIDRGSASGSEILAGAVKDNGRGVIVGTRSFGKASVQKVFSLDNGAGMKYTIEHYETPSGAKIHGLGIEPDIFVEAKEETVPLSWLDDKPDSPAREYSDTEIPRVYLSQLTDKQLQSAVSLLESYRILAGEKP